MFKKIKLLHITIFAFVGVINGLQAQRIVLPGQELLIPQLTDPSYVGENNRVQITALGQFAESNFDETSYWGHAQFVPREKFAVAVEFFNDNLEPLHFSTVMLSLKKKFMLGDYSAISLGASGGIETLKQDYALLNQTTNQLTNISDPNIEFAYKGGLHINLRNLFLGGVYNLMPLQTKLNTGLITYETTYGYNGYLGYNIGIGEKFTITPKARYLAYGDGDPIYEGSLLLNFLEKVKVGAAYRHDYSVNPAISALFLDRIQLGYSYEMALGEQNFDNIHSLSLSYLFKKRYDDEMPIPATDKIKESKTDGTKDTKEASTKESQLAVNDAKENVEADLDDLENDIDAKSSQIADAARDASSTNYDVEKNTTEKINDIKSNIDSQAKTAANELPSTGAYDGATTAINNSTNTTPKVSLLVMSARYYVVVTGSYERIAEAYPVYKKLKSEGHSVLLGIDENTNMHYVYLDSNFSKKGADEKMAKLSKSTGISSLKVVKID